MTSWFRFFMIPILVSLYVCFFAASFLSLAALSWHGFQYDARGGRQTLHKHWPSEGSGE